MNLGVCSWSLQPDSPDALVQALQSTGLGGVQLALDPLRTGQWGLDETKAALAQHNLQIFSGMMGTEGEDYSSLDSIARTGGVRPDEHWEQNLSAAHTNAELAAQLGLKLVTLHAGFLPEERENQERDKLIERLRDVIDAFAAHGVSVGFETGQETAPTLLEVLEDLDRKTVGVNFDPANMILYDKGNPVEALQKLLPHVLQVHIKDATRTLKPGTWGAEVPVGKGEVNWAAFFSVLASARKPIDLMIEREAGEDRIGDIKIAAEHIQPLAF